MPPKKKTAHPKKRPKIKIHANLAKELGLSPNQKKKLHKALKSVAEAFIKEPILLRSVVVTSSDVDDGQNPIQ